MPVQGQIQVMPSNRGKRHLQKQQCCLTEKVQNRVLANTHMHAKVLPQLAKILVVIVISNISTTKLTSSAPAEKCRHGWKLALSTAAIKRRRRNNKKCTLDKWLKIIHMLTCTFYVKCYALTCAKPACRGIQSV